MISDRDYRVTDVPLRGFWSYYAELLGIEPEGPASVGGLILGDVLVSGDGQPLAQPRVAAPNTASRTSSPVAYDASRGRRSGSRICIFGWFDRSRRG